mmetsp:Transcript_18801/g.51500  ORF Transcript_18801/g.51500 Transcript_18801/m.51500 type:complete len:221 (+) Transcript_18801:799-1461(+)
MKSIALSPTIRVILPARTTVACTFPRTCWNKRGGPKGRTKMSFLFRNNDNRHNRNKGRQQRRRRIGHEPWNGLGGFCFLFLGTIQREDFLVCSLPVFFCECGSQVILCYDGQVWNWCNVGPPTPAHGSSRNVCLWHGMAGEACPEETLCSSPRWKALQWADPKKRKDCCKVRDRNNSDHELGGVAKLAFVGSIDYDFCVEDILLTGEVEFWCRNKTLTTP